METWASKLARQPALVVAAVATLAHVFIYGLANQFPFREPRELPLLILDRATPFVPATVWIYLSDYALCFVGLAAHKAASQRLRFISLFLSGVVLAALFHGLFPITYPRALYPFAADGTLTSFALVTLRRLDSPASCMPSLHVITATLSAWSAGRALPAWRTPLLIWAGLIVCSTLTVKQHYAADVVAGLLLAWGLQLLSDRITKTFPMEQRLQRLDAIRSPRESR